MKKNNDNKKRVLLIAYHFPPLQGSSGLLRPLKFIKYLPQFGYDSHVLTVNQRAYEKLDNSLMNQIPGNVKIFKSLAFHTKKHLSIKGKYLKFMSLPDQLVSWIPFGILYGLYIIIRYRIDAIYSTFPIPSANIIGMIIKKILRKPWIVDFRDPMWDSYWPTDPLEKKIRIFIEKKSVRIADKIIVTTQEIRNLFLNRYPDIDKSKIEIIYNGYDNPDFEHLNGLERNQNKPVKLIHTGLLNKDDRNPSGFFKAISYLKKSKKIGPESLIVELYAPGNENEYSAQIKALNISDIIIIKSHIAYHKALELMHDSDILLLFQGPTCDEEIPAKIFEYFRIGRPVFGLTTETGATGKLIKEVNGGVVVPINDVDKIAILIEKWINNIAKQEAIPSAKLEDIEIYSRENQSKKLAHCYNEVLS